MNEDAKNALISYRMERATESLEAAELLLEKGMLTSAMNRIYYAMFYSVQAVLITKNAIFSKHGQVKGYFNKEFVHKGLFSVHWGKLYNQAFEYRQKFDYIEYESINTKNTCGIVIDLTCGPQEILKQYPIHAN